METFELTADQYAALRRSLVGHTETLDGSEGRPRRYGRLEGNDGTLFGFVMRRSDGTTELRTSSPGMMKLLRRQGIRPEPLQTMYYSLTAEQYQQLRELFPENRFPEPSRQSGETAPTRGGDVTARYNEFSGRLTGIELVTPDRAVQQALENMGVAPELVGIPRGGEKATRR